MFSCEFKKTFKKTRSSPPEVFCKKDVRRNFTKFTGKYLCQSLFFNKVADLRPATLLKTRSGTSIFLWILWNFWEHLSLNTSGGCFWKTFHIKQLRWLLLATFNEKGKDYKRVYILNVNFEYDCFIKRVYIFHAVKLTF